MSGLGLMRRPISLRVCLPSATRQLWRGLSLLGRAVSRAQHQPSLRCMVTKVGQTPDGGQPAGHNPRHSHSPNSPTKWYLQCTAFVSLGDCAATSLRCCAKCLFLCLAHSRSPLPHPYLPLHRYCITFAHICSPAPHSSLLLLITLLHCL
jgi:hypothetical protein